MINNRKKTAILPRNFANMVLAGISVLLLGACSDSAPEISEEPTPSIEAPAAVSGAAEKAPDGMITLANGLFDSAPIGYIIEEYWISGVANSFKFSDQAKPSTSWEIEQNETAAYKTRIVVVRPVDKNKFNGTVLLEWLNVSAGTDGAPDWTYLHREITRNGYAWVGVSAQKVGIYGSERGIPGLLPLKKANPERYNDLNHPGDAFSYDMFSQVASAVRSGNDAVLGPLKMERILAVGESQSAGYLTTYVNSIQPREKVFDGFLIHSRFGGSAPLETDYITSMQTDAESLASKKVKIRDDIEVPVFMFITETDLISPSGYLGARQPDTDTIRTWEVAGTAHADSYTLSAGYVDDGDATIAELAAAYAPSDNMFGQPLEKPINSAPQHHYVMQGALVALNKWVAAGTPPPVATPLAISESDSASLVLDEHGNAQGGVRSPWVDAPVAKLSGLGQDGGGFARLFGSTEVFSQSKIDDLYPSGRAEYLEKFGAALQSSIDAGNILADDREEIEALAAAMYPGE